MKNSLKRISKMKNSLKSFRLELISLFKLLKKHIDSETLIETGDGEKQGIEVTIGYSIVNGEIDWNYQTGCNEYTGAAYGYRFWAVTSLMKRTNCTAAAQEIIDQLLVTE